MGTNTGRSFEFTLFDEHGIKITYNRDEHKLIFNGWYNYVVPMEEFSITLEDFVKSLEIPAASIKLAYDPDVFAKKTRPRKKAKKKTKYKREEKLFRWRRGDQKPSHELICQWKECRKTFTTRQHHRKYCCQECARAAFGEMRKSNERKGNKNKTP